MAQVRFRELSDKWHAASPEGRLQLEQPLRQFLESFPYDDLRRPARVYLAWILVQKGDISEARELIDATRAGPPGSANDLAVVSEAALLLQLNQSQEALELLRRVRGKLIDPVERFLLAEQLVAAALGSELYAEALLYMVDWGAQAPVTQQAAVREAIISRLHQTPRRYLERALVELEAAQTAAASKDPAQRDQTQWMRDAIAHRLTALAIAERDVELAKFVLEESPGLGGDRDAAEELLQLATGNDTVAQIQGRTVGVVLVTESAQQRVLSSEVATAVSASLGLPRAATAPGSVRLVFAEDSGGAAGAELAFANLQARGVGIVIAGVDAESANLHARQAEKSGVPSLLLHPHDLERPEFSYTIGVSRAEQEAAWTELLNARAYRAPRVVAPDDAACQSASDAPIKAALREWKEASVDGVLLLVPLDCARRFLAQSVSSSGARRGQRAEAAGPSVPWFALGLDAAPSALQQPEARAIPLRAGGFPFAAADATIALWMARQARPPSWHEVLGHDAASIASSVLMGLPEVLVSKAGAVRDYHEQVKVRLRSLQGLPLWSVTSAHFDDRQVLERRLQFLAPAP